MREEASEDMTRETHLRAVYPVLFSFSGVFAYRICRNDSKWLWNEWTNYSLCLAEEEEEVEGPNVSVINQKVLRQSAAEWAIRPRDEEEPHPLFTISRIPTSTTFYQHSGQKCLTIAYNHTPLPHTPVNTIFQLHRGTTTPPAT